MKKSWYLKLCLGIKKVVYRTRRQRNKEKSWYQELEDSLKSEKKLVLRTRRQPKGQKK